MTAQLTSCEHKDLCFDHEDHALRYAVQLNFTYEQLWHEDYSYYNDPDVDIDGAWVVDSTQLYDDLMPELTPDIPSGIRALVYCSNGERHTFNFEADGGSLLLCSGRHQLLFYNNDSEYIIFEDDESRAAEITLTTRTRNRSSYHGSPYINTGTRAESTVAAPDMLYFGFIENYQAVAASTTPDTLEVDMYPLVCTYVIQFNFERGSEYVALARGALAGMAGSVKLYNGETPDDDIATVLFDCELQESRAQAVVNTFGAPGYRLQNTETYLSMSRAEHTFGLNLELRLVNGKMLTFDYDVTDQVSMQPQGGIIFIDGISIEPSDTEGVGTASGFDVTVDGWGEYQDITLPL
jgi:hypothetical protein